MRDLDTFKRTYVGSVFLQLAIIFAGIFGYVANIFLLIATVLSQGWTPLAVLRVIGVFIVPLGCITGYIGL